MRLGEGQEGARQCDRATMLLREISGSRMASHCEGRSHGNNGNRGARGSWPPAHSGTHGALTAAPRTAGHAAPRRLFSRVIAGLPTEPPAGVQACGRGLWTRSAWLTENHSVMLAHLRDLSSGSQCGKRPREHCSREQKLQAPPWVGCWIDLAWV